MSAPHICIEIDSVARPSGRAAAVHGAGPDDLPVEHVAFDGWLGLLRVLSDLIDSGKRAGGDS